MSTLAVRGRYHDGTVELTERPMIQGEADVVVVFLPRREDVDWEGAAAADFLEGYSESDNVYDDA